MLIFGIMAKLLLDLLLLGLLILLLPLLILLLPLMLPLLLPLAALGIVAKLICCAKGETCECSEESPQAPEESVKSV